MLRMAKSYNCWVFVDTAAPYGCFVEGKFHNYWRKEKKNLTHSYQDDVFWEFTDPPTLLHSLFCQTLLHVSRKIIQSIKGYNEGVLEPSWQGCRMRNKGHKHADFSSLVSDVGFPWCSNRSECFPVCCSVCVRATVWGHCTCRLWWMIMRLPRGSVV